MLVTIDIPDAEYRELKSQAELEGKSLEDLIQREVRRVTRAPGEARQMWDMPVLPSKNPGSLKLGEEGVYEYIPFP